MTDHGAQFGVDIADLYQVAKDIDVAADSYDQAATSLAATSFDSTGDISQTPYGSASVVAPWSTLQSELLDALNTTVQNLRDSSAALKKAADHYAATDQDAAAEFQQIKAKIDKGGQM